MGSCRRDAVTRLNKRYRHPKRRGAPSGLFAKLVDGLEGRQPAECPQSNARSSQQQVSAPLHRPQPGSNPPIGNDGIGPRRASSFELLTLSSTSWTVASVRCPACAREGGEEGTRRWGRFFRLKGARSTFRHVARGHEDMA